MTTKSVVIGLAHGDADYDDIAGTIHMDSSLVYIYVGDVRTTIPVSELMDFLKSELMGE